MAGEEEQDGVKRVATDRTDFLLGDLSKSKRRAALEINVVRKGECGQRGEWRAGEKVGCRPVLKMGKVGDEDVRRLKVRRYVLSRY
jgi:hypothetical protein